MINLQKPLSVAIETTNFCNAKCTFCPNKYLKRAKGIMSQSLFEKIIAELIEIEPKYVLPSLNGEPFMDPYIIERIKLINQKIPSAKVMLFTNASLMTPKISDEISNLKIESITFSLNATTKERYHQIMNLDYEKTINHIDYFIKNNKQIKTIKISLVLKDTSTEEIAYFKNKWGDKAFLGKYVNFGGRMYNASPSSKACSRALSEMCVLWNGDISLCCMDMEGEIIHGNVNQNSLLEIWNNDGMKKLRELHLTGSRVKYPLCNNCNEA